MLQGCLGVSKKAIKAGALHECCMSLSDEFSSENVSLAPAVANQNVVGLSNKLKRAYIMQSDGLTQLYMNY